MEGSGSQKGGQGRHQQAQATHHTQLSWAADDPDVSHVPGRADGEAEAWLGTNPALSCMVWVLAVQGLPAPSLLQDPPACASSHAVLFCAVTGSRCCLSLTASFTGSGAHSLGER